MAPGVVVFSAPGPTTSNCPWMSLLGTPEHSQASCFHLLSGHFSFLLGPGAPPPKGLLVAQMVMNLPAIHQVDMVGKIPWRGEWKPPPLFFPGEFHWKRSLAGYSPWCCEDLDMSEWLTLFSMDHLYLRRSGGVSATRAIALKMDQDYACPLRPHFEHQKM